MHFLARAMSLEQLQMNAGAFKVNLPYTIGGWIVWAIGLVVAIAGLVLGMNDSMLLILSAVGFMIMAISSPGSLEADLHRVRKESMSVDQQREDALKKGYSVDNWWLGRTTYTPTNDPSDWILPAPGAASWHQESPYDADEGGEPIAEHPQKVGTPIPATISSFAIFAWLAIGCIIYWAFALIKLNSDEGKSTIWIPAIASGLGLIGLLTGWFKAKMIRQMIDTPTSLTRSMAAGQVELVGQVRPAKEGAMRVLVDGAEHRAVDHMVSYRWSHEIYVCRKVKQDDGSYKEECSWREVSSDAGAVPFLLHDGTGGVRINAPSFKRREFGNYLRQWHSNHADTIGKEIFGNMLTKVVSGGDVRKHRWTLWGLRLGNPVYLMGNAVSRSSEDLAAEGLDGTLPNSLLQVDGDDAPGLKANMQRGSELANLGTMRSGFELVITPALLLIGGLALFGVA